MELLKPARQGMHEPWKLPFKIISLCVLRNTRKMCIEVWLYYVCITHYLATCKCGLSLISSHHMFVWWHGKPCHSPFLLWVIWGVCICPKQSFVLHESSLVVRKHRKELYVQTRTAVMNRAHIMGIEYGVSTKNISDQDSLYPYRVRLKMAVVRNLSTNQFSGQHINT